MQTSPQKLHQILKNRWQHYAKHSLTSKILLWFCLTIVGLILLGIFTLAVTVAVLSQGIPTTEELQNIYFTESTQILDREGNLLYTIHGEENREKIKLEDVSPYLIYATLAIEDQHFYEHHGFYLKRIIGALINNLRGRPVQGASTITQQFIKNTFLSPEKTYKRKAQELILAIKLESRFDKDEILEMYLNKIPYGNNAYGIQQAAKIYFGKNAKDLTLAESAILAALPKAPSRYNPYGEHRYSFLLKDFSKEELETRTINSENNLAVEEFSRGLLGKYFHLDEKNQFYIRGRADLVLREMLETNYITEEEKQNAWEETQNIEFKEYREDIKSPHFVLYVKEILEERYGKEIVEKGGLRVYTTIDPHLQETAEQLAKEYADINTGNYGASNTALVAIQPQTGQILAMVGSKDYWNDEIDGKVNIATRLRQPGSSFKPFMYSLAFKKRYAPATILYDVKTKFDAGDPPQNYDGTYRGPVTIRQALGQSLNIPSIKIYFLVGGQKEIIPFVAEIFGIKSLNPDRDYNWPLGLGTGEVSLLEMVSGYAVLANSGVRKEITPILKIEDRNGKELEKWEEDIGKEQVLDPQIAFLINDILSDRSVNLGQKLEIEGHINAAKTGTSNKQITKEKILPSNTWAFLYTTKLVSGVWAGNNDGSVLKENASGYAAAAPFANEFMTEALKDQVSEPFPKPAGIQEVTVSKVNGKLPGPGTGDNTVTDYFASYSIPTEIDNDYREATVDMSTHELATEYCPEEYVETKVFRYYHSIDPQKYPNWEEAVQAWARGIENALPVAECHLHNEETYKNKPTLIITNPQAFGTITPGKILVEIKANAKNGIEKIEFYLDGNMQYTAMGPPYNGLLRLSQIAQEESKHTIMAKLYDAAGYTASSEIQVKVAQSKRSEIKDIIKEALEERTLEVTPLLEVIPVGEITPVVEE